MLGTTIHWRNATVTEVRSDATAVISNPLGAVILGDFGRLEGPPAITLFHIA
jgi:hypothetical protein